MKSLVLILMMSIGWIQSVAQDTQAKIQEVYGAKAAEFMAQSSQWLISITELVEHRIKIVEMPNSSSDKYIKLSQVALLNKYNPSLQRDLIYDAATFNPLKYDFVTSSKTAVLYRIDNTDFVIVIEPQSFK